MSRDGEQLLARLTDLATTDALTGVANRRRGEALLEQEIKRARRYKAPLALIAFDIDHFKAINDRYGHPCGDAALRIVGEATQAALARQRPAGALRRRRIPDRRHAHQRDRRASRWPKKSAWRSPTPPSRAATGSPSASPWPRWREEESADSLMLRVSAALARAKRAGRNCVELAMQ